jgi:cysteine desulfurase
MLVQMETQPKLHSQRSTKIKLQFIVTLINLRVFLTYGCFCVRVFFMKRVYFDNSASTPVDRQVMSTYVDNYVDNFGNPSSVHSFGQRAKAELERARLVAADFVGCGSQEIVFTASATEANNIVINGVIKAALVGNSGRLTENTEINAYNFGIRTDKPKSTSKPHILISAIEHASVADFVSCGDADVETFKVDGQGLADLDDLMSKIRPETALVSLMYVNNEIGTAQPVKDLGAKLAKLNFERFENGLQRIFFHCDGVQAGLWFDIDVKELGVDFFVLSAHKMYAPKGAAMLFIKKGVEIKKSIFGGGQEKGLSSGTQNVQAIVAFAEAMKIAKNGQETDAEKVMEMRDYLINFVDKNIPTGILNGSREQRSPNNAHFTFVGFDQDVLLTKLDLEGFAVSAGSSCSSGANEPSHIPKMLDPNITGADLRITLGKQNTIQEVQDFCKALKKILLGHF